MKQRMRSLITSNARAVIESCPQELFTTDGYPEPISISAGIIQPGCLVTANRPLLRAASQLS